MGCQDNELSVVFTDDQRIAELNETYLQRKGPTNVLAFPMADPSSSLLKSPMLGDIVISVDTAIREAEATAESLTHTIYRLLIHGLLHLMGYDHEVSSEQSALMEKEANRLMALITRQ